MAEMVMEAAVVMELEAVADGARVVLHMAMDMVAVCLYAVC